MCGALSIELQCSQPGSQQELANSPRSEGRLSRIALAAYLERCSGPIAVAGVFELPVAVRRMETLAGPASERWAKSRISVPWAAHPADGSQPRQSADCCWISAVRKF